MNVKHSTLRREDASSFAKATADGMEGEENLETCVFTKRTHRFGDGKVMLSNWRPMGSNGKSLGISVGSFSKTNPPGGGFRGVLRGFEGVLGWFSAEILSYRRRSERSHCGARVNRRERFAAAQQTARCGFASLRMTTQKDTHGGFRA